MPDPLKPAPLLGLVELAALAVVAVVGELVKRFAQLWGSNNSRAKVTPIHQQYAFFSVGIDTSNLDPSSTFIGSAAFTGKLATSQYFVVFQNNAPFGANPQTDYVWPGTVKHTNTHPNNLSGWGYWLIRRYPDIPNSIKAEQNMVFPSGVEKAFAPTMYKFFNSASQVEPSATWNGDPSVGSVYDAVPVIPTTSPSPLDRLPPVPAATAEQSAPLKQAQAPAAEGAPVVPVVTPSPALVTTAQTTRTSFYVPDRLPAPLAPPATKTRTTTGAGTVVAPAVLPIPQTSTDQRVYGTQVITSIGVRPDVVAIAEEVGRMEQKLGRLLGGMDTTPDWLDGALGPLLNQLKDVIIDALVVDVPATVYDFEAPCDVDANGNPVVLEQAIAAADYQPAIVARLDAIAAAMGILKGWKQPMCRTSPPRSNVTVTAFEFNPEA
jgi:hypothetical protein